MAFIVCLYPPGSYKNNKSLLKGSNNIIYKIKMVPGDGLEPSRYFYRWILSPLRLPIPPLGQQHNYLTILFFECTAFFYISTSTISSKINRFSLSILSASLLLSCDICVAIISLSSYFSKISRKLSKPI